MLHLSEPIPLQEHRATISPSVPDTGARHSGKAWLPENNVNKRHQWGTFHRKASDALKTAVHKIRLTLVDAE